MAYINKLPPQSIVDMYLKVYKAGGASPDTLTINLIKKLILNTANVLGIDIS
jgi:hypothetical protein